LPDAHLAVIDESKITHYLLASNHPAGRAKATVLERFGFRVADWQVLRDALLAHGARRSNCVGRRHDVWHQVYS